MIKQTNKKFYVYVEDIGSSEIIPLGSEDIEKLKVVIKEKYKHAKFQKRFGTVLDEYGDILGWIQEVGRVV